MSNPADRLAHIRDEIARAAALARRDAAEVQLIAVTTGRSAE
jgi:uncharacterized pyridoxal phosphate-containing UPF0001 family protein